MWIPFANLTCASSCPAIQIHHLTTVVQPESQYWALAKPPRTCSTMWSRSAAPVTITYQPLSVPAWRSMWLVWISPVSLPALLPSLPQLEALPPLTKLLQQPQLAAPPPLRLAPLPLLLLPLKRQPPRRQQPLPRPQQLLDQPLQTKAIPPHRAIVMWLALPLRCPIHPRPTRDPHLLAPSPQHPLYPMSQKMTKSIGIICFCFRLDWIKFWYCNEKYLGLHSIYWDIIWTYQRRFYRKSKGFSLPPESDEKCLHFNFISIIIGCQLTQLSSASRLSSRYWCSRGPSPCGDVNCLMMPLVRSSCAAVVMGSRAST